MTDYLLSIYQPDGDPPPSIQLEKIMRDVNALNQEMKAAGVWVFANGLHQPGTATVVQVKDGHMLTSDGPYVEGKEHLGGLCIVKAPDLDAALEWGRKLASALTYAEGVSLPVEVRPFQDGRGH